jgi:hypothetical protein
MNHGTEKRKLGKKIDFEIAKYKHLWFRAAKDHGWHNDIRDHGWRMLKSALRAARMRQAKVRKHDEARTLLSAAQDGGSMDFWDKLSLSEKQLCREVIKQIERAPEEQ